MFDAPVYIGDGSLNCVSDINGPENPPRSLGFGGPMDGGGGPMDGPPNDGGSKRG
jgi:hypothetical protein